MSTESPAISAALLRGILRDSAAVHDLLTARGCQWAGKAIVVGAALLAKADRCETPEQLATWIDSL